MHLYFRLISIPQSHSTFSSLNLPIQAIRFRTFSLLPISLRALKFFPYGEKLGLAPEIVYSIHPLPDSSFRIQLFPKNNLATAFSKTGDTNPCGLHFAYFSYSYFPNSSDF